MDQKTLLKKLKIAIPMAEVVVPLATDPRQSYKVQRQNLEQLLTFNPKDLTVDAQMTPALYAELHQIAVGARKRQKELEREYRIWKSARVDELIKKAEKKPTGAEQEAYYRRHKDYKTVAGAAEVFAAIADWAEGMRDAFKMKADLIRSASWSDATYTDGDSVSDVDLARLEESIDQSESAAAAAEYAESAGEPDEEEDFDEEEDSEEEGDEEDSEEDDEEDSEEEDFDEEEDSEEEGDEEDSEEDDEEEDDDLDEEDDFDEEDDEEGYEPPPPPKRAAKKSPAKKVAKKAPAKKSAPAKKVPTKKRRAAPPPPAKKAPTKKRRRTNK